MGAVSLRLHFPAPRVQFCGRLASMPVPPDRKLPLTVRADLDLARQGRSLAQIAASRGKTKQAVQVGFARYGFSIKEVRPHLPKRRKRPRVTHARCAHCGHTLRVAAADDGRPRFCATNDRGCRTAYRRWLARSNAAVREHLNAYRRDRYWAERAGTDDDARPTQYCFNCGDPLPNYRPDSGLRACRKPVCRARYYSRQRFIKLGKEPKS